MRNSETVKYVFRYEHPTHKCGPYLRCHGIDSIKDAHNNLESRHTPGASEDGLDDPWEKLIGGYRFACPSIQLLNKWFEGFHDTLREAGFIVAVYEVPTSHVKVGASGLQCAFNIRHAKRL
jgi:hypothetical protein